MCLGFMKYLVKDRKDQDQNKNINVEVTTDLTLKVDNKISDFIDLENIQEELSTDLHYQIKEDLKKGNISKDNLYKD